jgi:nucleoid-associated protein YgaU
VYYDEGIGTDKTGLRKIGDGMFGRGMLRILRNAYRFLIFNYEPGDEIFAFGFSRGAYTARSFVGFIRHAGILDIASATRIDEAIEIYRTAPAGIAGLESPAGMEFRSKYSCGICVSAADRDYRAKHVPGFDPATASLLSIRYLGVWDTVRALGVPEFLPGSVWFNRKYGFHNAVLTSKIKAARHAVALDELRPTFRATLFGQSKVAELNARTMRKGQPAMPDWLLPYQEQWFPGVHGAVGGGGARRGLSDGALEWVLAGARQAKLDLRDGRDNVAYGLCPDPTDDLQNDPRQPWYKRGWPGALLRLTWSPRPGPGALAELALPTLRRWHAAPAKLAERSIYRPRALAAIADKVADWAYREPPQWKSAAQPLEEYTVQYGDTLSKLAKQQLGEAKRWPELFELNRDRIDNPDQLSIGAKLRLPVKSDRAEPPER